MMENQQKIIKISEKKNSPNSQNQQNQNLNNKYPNQNNSTSLSSQEEEINNKNEFNNGRWSDEEHKKFIEGILEHGNEWKKVQKIIKTRSSTQARSHAQKFFLRIKRSLGEFNSDKNNIIDNNEMIKYIIETYINNKKTENELTNEQKEKLINVINCKYNNNNNNNNNIINNNNYYSKKNNNNFNNIINENEIDKIINDKKNKISVKENSGNKIKLKIEIDDNEMNDNISYVKRKSTPSNKIFKISKDLTHRYSMEIPVKNNNNENPLTPLNNMREENNYFSFKDNETNSKNNEKLNNPFNIQFNFSKDDEMLDNVKSLHFDINENEHHLLNNYINYDNDLMQIDDDSFLNYNNQKNN